MANKIESVHMFIAWDDGDDKKVVFLCRTPELAEQLQEKYKKGKWDHTVVEEIKIYDSLIDAEGWPI